MYIAKKDTDCKSNRHKEELFKLLDGRLTLKEISEKLKVSKELVRVFAKVNNLKFKRGNLDLSVDNIGVKNSKENKIIKLLNEGYTYAEIGEKIDLKKRKVENFARNAGIKRYDKTVKENCENIISQINEDFDKGMSYENIVKKYNLNDKKLRSDLLRFGLEPLFQKFKKVRDSKILEEYKINTASTILNSNEKDLISPRKIKTKSKIYAINSNAGFKKFPKIINRFSGGSFEDKEIIKFIKKKREKDGLSFNKIAILLNEMGKKTVTGTTFKDYLVRYKYNHVTLKSNKRIIQK